MKILVLLMAIMAMPAMAQREVPVGVAQADVRPVLQQLQITGSVTAARRARLSAETSGKVQAVLVEEGTRVAAGDVLIKLDQEIAQLEFDAASARKHQADLAVQDARRRLREARELIPQASIAESVVRDTEAEVAEDQAAFAAATAEARRLEALLERTEVRAPFDAVVAAKLTEIGEWVSPGQSVLALVSSDEVRLDFAVADDYLGAIDDSVRVTYRVGLGNDRSYEGRIATAVPVSDPAARTFLLRVLPQDDAPALVPGMSVKADVQVPAGRDGVVVSRDAIVRYPDGRSVVWVIVEADGITTVGEKRVQQGLQFGGLVEILSGLEGNERVVVRGNEALRAGQPVRITDIASPAV